MAPSRRGRTSLTQGLDREVHQVIRNVIDQRSAFAEDAFVPTFANIYDEIKRSNSSLNRKPKKLLEDSIERVLDVIRQDLAETDSEAELEQQQQRLPLTPGPPNKASNAMNKSIVAKWSAAPATNGMTTPTTETMAEETSTKNAQEPPRKKRKRAPEINLSPPTNISLANLGGVDTIVEQFQDLLTIPLMCPTISMVQSVRGILIHGPPGCGKTTIANAIAAEYGVNFINISAPSLVSGMSGESEKALRECFEQAKQAAPCLLFLDEIDAITPKRESASREMEKRIVAQLATLMDGLDPALNEGKTVVVLAATNRPDALDPALRRGGRFDKEIHMNVPSEDMRHQILRALTSKLALADDVDLQIMARRTPGYVGADLKDLVSTANNLAIKRFQATLAQDAADTAVVEASAMQLDTNGTSENENDRAGENFAASTQAHDEELSPATIALRNMLKFLRQHPPEQTTITITQTDFLTGLPRVSPSALREGFATVPHTTFAQIGGLTPIIATLTESIIGPILNPAMYTTMNISMSSGALLFGPPGCGKTLLARAIANASHANFIAVKGPELLNKYVGESERAVRSVFQRARSSVPCLIFFDELDGVVPPRADSSEASARVVNTLLTELDGVSGDKAGIFVLGATNRPNIIDQAVLRPGRLDSLVYVGMPDGKGRKEILQAQTKDMPGMAWNERMDRLVGYVENGQQGGLCPCDGFSGADMAHLKNKAGMVAIRRARAKAGPGKEPDRHALKVATEDFEVAVSEIGRSVRESDLKMYEKLRKEWEKIPGAALIAS
ncbi:putative AAA domain-containing protein [Cyphellophora attinorum]|uniref:Putative AAA domain-containing protein n=1 Tax=Cyphellophora attinorum TaxID=1664694 RepID=A0A0N1HFL2_9EURO|nr:putative AAA domain-containing protein [Phialophora attinorum]KPI44046.1 putative AAA domain-containing protein [Phialophora attinorum]